MASPDRSFDLGAWRSYYHALGGRPGARFRLSTWELEKMCTRDPGRPRCPTGAQKPSCGCREGARLVLADFQLESSGLGVHSVLDAQNVLRAPWEPHSTVATKFRMPEIIYGCPEVAVTDMNLVAILESFRLKCNYHSPLKKGPTTITKLTFSDFFSPSLSLINFSLSTCSLPEEEEKAGERRRTVQGH